MASTNGNILVVDDDRLNRIKLSINLEAAGYSVAVAANGSEGLDMMRAEPFDTVLLDLMMPVLDGFQVMEQVQADAALQNIPIIIISGEEGLDSVVRCIEMGAADHLPKPFNPVILRARISACVSKKRSRDRELELYDELQHRYAQLQELQKLRDDLTHMIVHDLRTPLTSLLAGLQSVPLMGQLNPDQAECFDMAEQGGEGLLAMINELLDISKMEDGSLPLQSNSFDPVTLAQRAFTQVEHLAQAKQLTLHLETVGAIPLLRADEEKLLRVMVNLCGNAIKFTPPGGTINVKIQPPTPADNNRMVFSVADTGEGIPAAYFSRIFEKFGQVETRISGQKMSTGLGLTFCKMVVEKHEGKIWVESEPGQGSTFSFYIPTG